MSFAVPSTKAVLLSGSRRTVFEFLGGQLNPLISFTRASSGTYFDSNGVMQTATTNVARFNYKYNGSAWVVAGLLIEPAATNLILRSAEFDNASWTKGRSSVTANAIASPDGTTTADKIVEDTTVTATHRIYQLTAKAASSLTRTFSVYLKAGERTKTALRFTDQVESVAARADFDLSAGTVGSVTIGGGATITAASATITNVGGGWYRCTITATFDATITSTGAFIGVLNDAGGMTYTGDGASGLYAWGAQVEDGSVATSYIATTTATVTRAADVASITGSNFSSWYNPTEGTFVVEYAVQGFVANQHAFAVSDDTSTESLAWYSSTGFHRIIVYDGGVIQSTTVGLSSAPVAGTVYKSAVAYKTNDLAISTSGNAPGTDTLATLPTVDRLYIGANATGTGQFNGHIRSLTYYPTRLSNAQLVTLSTL